jgi:class 3 adenylate cyclase
MSTDPISASASKPGLSIQSILLIMLLLVSILSSLVIGAIGFINGRESLRDAAFASLTEVRDSRAREVKGLFTNIENSLLVDARGESVTMALTDFSAAFAELGDTELTDEQNAAVDAWYTDTFAAELNEATGETVQASAFIPRDTDQRWLAAHYTIDDVDVDETTWGEANARFDDYFEHMTELLGYRDALLIDGYGTVVYSAGKGVDLGTDLLAGPYRFSNLATAYTDALSKNIVDDVVFSDFDTYEPQLAQPTAWAVAPVAVDGQIIGAIAVALPIEEINAVMTTDGDWSTTALGDTGETYLVGDDALMRSNSRDVIQHPGDYETAAIASGVDPEVAAKAVDDQESILIQPVNTTAVSSAFASASGTLIENGYLGGETLSSYAPLTVEELHWVIVAQMDTSEAFAPVDDFTKKLAISSAVILFVVALLSIVLAQIIVRPLKRLKVAARRIAAGEVGVQVNAGRSDELAELGAAFNDMSTSLMVKANLLEEQQKENDRLLSFLMPESVAKRYREGVQTISQEHQEVTVIYADIVGFEDFGRSLGSEKALEQLNDLYRRFDEAAEEHGIERVRTTRQGYLASCGLSVPRVDHARRTVDFAIEMQTILSRFGGQQGVELNVRAGIDSGTVTSGLVGRSHVAYDLWGDAVNLAFNLQRGTNEAGVFVTERVFERLSDTSDLIPSGEVETNDGMQKIWRLDLEVDRD